MVELLAPGRVKAPYIGWESVSAYSRDSAKNMLPLIAFPHTCFGTALRLIVLQRRANSLAELCGSYVAAGATDITAR